MYFSKSLNYEVSKLVSNPIGCDSGDWARPENLVEIGLVVEALDEFCGTGDVIV